jgi:hypothetical protein
VYLLLQAPALCVLRSTGKTSLGRALQNTHHTPLRVLHPKSRPSLHAIQQYNTQGALSYCVLLLCCRRRGGCPLIAVRRRAAAIADGVTEESRALRWRAVGVEACAGPPLRKENIPAKASTAESNMCMTGPMIGNQARQAIVVRGRAATKGCACGFAMAVLTGTRCGADVFDLVLFAVPECLRSTESSCMRCSSTCCSTRQKSMCTAVALRCMKYKFGRV